MHIEKEEVTADNKHVEKLTATDICAIFNNEEKRRRVGYARVSSPKQKEDLERQKKDIRDIFNPDYIIADCASSLNFNRPGLQRLLEAVHSGRVSEIAILHKDRMCRMGFELVEKLCTLNGTKIMVHDKTDGTSHDELTDDLLAVTTLFTARKHGLRGAAKRRARASRAENKTSAQQGATDPTTTMDGCGTMDL